VKYQRQTSWPNSEGTHSHKMSSISFNGQPDLVAVFNMILLYTMPPAALGLLQKQIM